MLLTNLDQLLKWNQLDQLFLYQTEDSLHLKDQKIRNKRVLIFQKTHPGKFVESKNELQKLPWFAATGRSRARICFINLQVIIDTWLFRLYPQSEKIHQIIGNNDVTWIT